MARPKGKTNDPNRRQLPFKQSEVERAIRAARAEDFNVTRIEIKTASGWIALVAQPTVASATDANPWDEVLNVKDAKRST